jgi:hypothetical protein
VSIAEQRTGCGRQRACSGVSRRIGSREQAELTVRRPYGELSHAWPAQVELPLSNSHALQLTTALTRRAQAARVRQDEGGRHPQALLRRSSSSVRVVFWPLMSMRFEAVAATAVSHPVLKAKPNALITCAPGSSYTRA